MSKFSKIGLLLLIFGAVGLIYAGQMRLLTLTTGMKMSWSDVLKWELTRWFLWPPFVPVILWLCRKRFYYSSSKVRFYFEHLTASVFISLGHLLVFSIVFWFLSLFLTAMSSGQSLSNAIASTPFDPQKVFKMIFTLDFHIGILVYWMVLIAMHAIEYSRRAADLNTKLAEARLDALKMQLHPHFLFNTLNSISALLHKDPEAADEMIGELGNFLRLTLQNPGKHEVALEEELKFLRSYLEIETVRFHNRLTVHFEIQPQTLAAQLPNLILQPIIENALRHAIARREEQGIIEVRSSRVDESLRLEVLDNGPGLNNNGAVKEGIGLQNVKERLAHHYGNSQTLQLRNRPEGGLRVELQIPFHTGSHKEEA